MATVSIRERRNSGGEVVDSVAPGERVTITRSAKPVAELRPLRDPPLPTPELIGRRTHLPHVDPDILCAGIDLLIDPSL